MSEKDIEDMTINDKIEAKILKTEDLDHGYTIFEIPAKFNGGRVLWGVTLHGRLKWVLNSEEEAKFTAAEHWLEEKLNGRKHSGGPAADNFYTTINTAGELISRTRNYTKGHRYSVAEAEKETKG